MVNEYYFYVYDKDFGPLFIKFCSDFPFGVKLCINGHEWLKCQLEQRGIGFEALDNGIQCCDEPVRAQQIADSLNEKKIEAVFRTWLARLPHPFSPQQQAEGYRYQLSIFQAEFATRTVLNRLWLEPRPDLIDFAERGIAIFKANPGVPISAMTWGMAIATYPFFGKVSELVGRLSALQGDCTSAEIHRRMSETYGEREGTSRMTNMVLQSQASRGVIERVEKGRRLVRRKPIVLNNEQAVAWLVEAGLRYAGKAVAVPTLSSLAVIYPFLLDQPLGYLASRSPNLEVRSEGAGYQLVGLQLYS